MPIESAILSLLLLGVGSLTYFHLRERYLFWHLPRKAYQLLSIGKYAETIALLETPIQRGIFGKEFHRAVIGIHLALAYQGEGQHEKVIQLLNTSLQDPDFARTLSSYATGTLIISNSLLALGREEEAETTILRLEAALENLEDSAESFEYRARCFAFQHKYAEAVESLKQNLQSLPPKASQSERLNVVTKLAQYCSLAILPQQTLDFALEIIQANTSPTSRLMAHYYACEAHCMLGQYDEAKKWYERGSSEAQKLQNRDYMAHFELLLSAMQLSVGDLDHAMTTAENAVQWKPELAVQNNMPASIRLIRGEHAEAISLFKKLLSPSNPPVSQTHRWDQSNQKLYLASAFLEMEQGEEALYYIHQAFPILRNVIVRRYQCEVLECWAYTLLRPGDPEVRANIRTLAERLLDHAEAHRKETPVSYFGLGYLGVAASNTGAYALGLRLLRFYNPPPSYTCFYTYQQGVCYEGLGQIAEAKTAYERCLASGIDIPRCQKAKAALARLSDCN